MEYINFTVEELFKNSHIEQFFDSSPIKRADMLANHLSNYLLVANKGKIYLYNNKTITYSVIPLGHTNPSEYLAMIARKFIADSYDTLSESNRRRMNKMYSYDTVYNINNYRDYALDIYYLLLDDQIKFNNVANEVHYRNGYINLKTLKFKSRNPAEHYITKYHDTDFQVEEEEETEEETEEDTEEDTDEEEETEEDTDEDYMAEDDEQVDLAEDVKDEDIKALVNWL